MYELTKVSDKTLAKHEANNIFVIANKVTSNLFNSAEIDDEGISYSIGYDKILATSALETDKNQKLVTVIKSLSDFDKAVLDAICSLYKSIERKMEAAKVNIIKIEEQKLGRPLNVQEQIKVTAQVDDMFLFSTKNVYATLIGTTKIDNFSKQNLASIEESIDLMSKIHIEITIFDKDSKKDTSVTTRLLPISKVKKKHNFGYIKNGEKFNDTEEFTFYQLENEPILLSYSTKMNLVSVVPISKLKNPLIKTQRNIALISFLETKIVDERISLISFDEIYERLQINDATNKKRIRDNVFLVLDCWQKNELISSWRVHETADNRYKTPISLMIDNDKEYSYESFIKSLSNAIEG